LRPVVPDEDYTRRRANDGGDGRGSEWWMGSKYKDGMEIDDTWSMVSDL
jgi:hypothetical protein